MRTRIEEAIEAVSSVVLGKHMQVRLALCTLLSRGHLLIEDMPGMGKTTLSHALARALGLSFTRLQFTSDMLPADIIGSSVFNQQDQTFSFVPGPVFTEVLLADEINRTTPKTQSALLEAMAEKQVTVDGETRNLPDHFFVIATQNPITQAGTFPLPESQLDRFLMRLDLGYPDALAEREMLAGADIESRLDAITPCLSPQDLDEVLAGSAKVKVSDSLLDYLQRLTEHTRTMPEYAYGLSPRGALAILSCARTWAYMEGRAHIVPEDVQAVLVPVCGHRLRAATEFHGNGNALAERLLNQVDVF